MRNGFTLVELSLSMAIISVLSIVVLLTISNAVSSYHKGLTLNQLNTVGISLVDDMRSTIQGSPGDSKINSSCKLMYIDGNNSNLCIEDGASSFTSVKRYANVTIGGNQTVNVPVYGAFCTGEYSYIWNSGYYFNEQDYKVEDTVPMAKFTFIDANGVEGQREKFKLLKVADSNKAVCKSAVYKSSDRGEYIGQAAVRSKLKEDFNITCGSLGATAGEKRVAKQICPKVDTDTIDTNLINNESGLAFYDLQSPAPAENKKDESMKYLFYSVSFILGTIQGGVNVGGINNSGDYCATPEDYDNSAVENFDYCAINKFNFAAQATGG